MHAELIGILAGVCQDEPTEAAGARGISHTTMKTVLDSNATAVIFPTHQAALQIFANLDSAV